MSQKTEKATTGLPIAMSRTRTTPWMCKAIHGAHTLKSPEFIKTWYYRIVVNTALDLLRKQKKLVLADDEAFEALHPGVTDPLEYYDLHQALETNSDEKGGTTYGS